VSESEVPTVGAKFDDDRDQVVPMTRGRRDDHALVREGIGILIARSGYTVVAEASNGQEALTPGRAVIDGLAAASLRPSRRSPHRPRQARSSRHRSRRESHR
jgi:hypothetical protein